MSTRKLFQPTIDELKSSKSRAEQIQGAMFEVLVENTEETREIKEDMKSTRESIDEIKREIDPIKQTHAALVRERWFIAKIGMVAGGVCAFLAFFLPWAVPNFWQDYRPTLRGETREIARETALETVKEYDGQVMDKIETLEKKIDTKLDKPTP